MRKREREANDIVHLSHPPSLFPYAYTVSKYIIKTDVMGLNALTGELINNEIQSYYRCYRIDARVRLRYNATRTREREKILCVSARASERTCICPCQCEGVSARASEWENSGRSKRKRERNGETRFPRSLALTHGRSLLPAAILRSPVDPAFPTARGKYWPTSPRDRALVLRPPRGQDAADSAARPARVRRTRTGASRRASTASYRPHGTSAYPAARDNSFHARFPSVVLSRSRYSRPRKYAGLHVREDVTAVAPERILTWLISLRFYSY